MPLRRVLLSLAFTLLFLGCKSADELYNEGQALELRGDYEAAAYLYADALEKEPGLRKAQGRLLEAGKLAVNQRLVRIDDAERAGSWVEAASQHRGLDGLAATASRVGVPLALPADYAEQRRANFDAAVATLLDAGGAAVARGDFDGAMQAYRRADTYEPSPEAAGLLADARLDATVAWAGADLAAGRYQAAFARAEDALAFVPPGSAAAAQILRLQTEALDRGSIRTAFTPLQPSQTRRGLPRGFLDALNDDLEIDRWTQPPPFVLTLEPALVRRALRDLGLRGAIDPPDAARLGYTLGVDAVFAGEVERFDRTAEERARETREARTRRGDRVTYTRIEDEVEIEATVVFDLVETDARRVLCSREVGRSANLRIARGVYDGPVRTLDLSRAERRLFNEEARADAERALEDELIDALAERIAEAAFDCLLAEVP
ncbi:MAG: hypothetical protein AAGI91_14265 [Bacteroidota bacterium]